MKFDATSSFSFDISVGAGGSGGAAISTSNNSQPYGYEGQSGGSTRVNGYGIDLIVSGSGGVSGTEGARWGDGWVYNGGNYNGTRPVSLIEWKTANGGNGQAGCGDCISSGSNTGYVSQGGAAGNVGISWTGGAGRGGNGGVGRSGPGSNGGNGQVIIITTYNR